jgi:hypothetical protein
MKLLMFRDSGLSGCDAVSLSEWFRLQRIMLSSSSRVSRRNHLGLLTLEHEGYRILRKVWNYLSNEVASYPRRLDSSEALLPELQNSRLKPPYKTFGSKADVTEKYGCLLTRNNTSSVLWEFFVCMNHVLSYLLCYKSSSLQKDDKNQFFIVSKFEVTSN